MFYRLLYPALLLSTMWGARVALGFCGFYVAKADTHLFNPETQGSMAP